MGLFGQGPVYPPAEGREPTDKGERALRTRGQDNGCKIESPVLHKHLVDLLVDFLFGNSINEIYVYNESWWDFCLET